MTKESVEKLVNDYYYLVKIIQRKHYPDKDYYTACDLQQEGAMGLWKAARTYDETKGAKFETWATRLIQNAMIDYFRSKSYHQEGMEQTTLDQPISDDNAETEKDRCTSEEGTDDIAIEFIQENAYQAWLDSLTLQDAKVWKMALEGYNYREIGEVMNFTSQTASNKLKRMGSEFKARC